MILSMTTNATNITPSVTEAFGFSAMLILMEMDFGKVRLRKGRCFSCGAKAPVAYTHSTLRPRTQGRCLPCLHSFLADKYEQADGQG